MTRRLVLKLVLCGILGVSILGCAGGGEPGRWDGATILISLDGFRWDYRNFVETPALDRLADRGVVSNLRPSFPTNTFPSHHTIATGLHPNRHGVVGNSIYDPEIGGRFSMGNEEAVRDGRWWGGEPIWVTVEKAEKIAATFFWPGTEAEIMGIRPTYFAPYDDGIPGEERVDQILEWLALPSAQRPAFLTLYFSDVDGAGHRHGPRAPETAEAIRRVDRYVDRLVHGLEEAGLTKSVNIVVVSDHGMSQIADERVVFLDDYVDPDEAGILSLGQHVALWPEEGDLDRIYEALHGAHEALVVYRRGEIPERLHLDGHRRTPPIIGLVEEGWSVSTRARIARRENPFSGGGHGYDNKVPNMEGLFIASGPAFREGVALQEVDAVDIYNVLCAAVGVEAAENDGDGGVMEAVLEPRGG